MADSSLLNIRILAVVDAVARMMADDVASAGLGIELVDAGPGRATVRMTVRPDMVNWDGIAHGGIIFLLADTAFACAGNSHGAMAVAAAANIVYVAAARQGDELVAAAVERTNDGRSGVYDVTVRRGAGEVIAEFRGHSRTIKRGG